MKFTTPCFVRVDNPQERKELKQWLKDMGYGISGATNSNQITTCPRSGQAYFGVWSNTEAIECDSISLFKALAAMNDESDREQWFICTKNHVCGDADDFETYFAGDMSLPWNSRKPGIFWRKATAEEIINHFKN